MMARVHKGGRMPRSGEFVTLARTTAVHSIAVIVGLASAACAYAQAQPAAEKRDGAALFMDMHRVLTHPRCLNCHPRGDSPKQGNERRVHMPPMTRGPRDHGPAGLQCSACHQTKNYPASGTPGAPGWHLAPRSQAWEGATPGEICRSILNRRTNGNKSLDEIVKHLTEDELVAWGWAPGKDISGKDREPVPIPKAEFNRIVHAWAKTGAVCPK